jgi:hypothetical protein
LLSQQREKGHQFQDCPELGKGKGPAIAPLVEKKVFADMLWEKTNGLKLLHRKPLLEKNKKELRDMHTEPMCIPLALS